MSQFLEIANGSGVWRDALPQDLFTHHTVRGVNDADQPPAWVIGDVHRLASVVSPTTRIFLTGSILNRAINSYCGGTYSPGGNVILLLSHSDRNVVLLISALFHELFHAVYGNMSVADRVTLCEMTARGLPWGNDYLDDDEERSARAFQYYAMSRLDSGVSHIYRTDMPSPHAVFERVLSGAYA